MADLPDDLFAGINKPDPFGPYQRREIRVEVVNGQQRTMQLTHIESTVNGVLNVIDEVRYLCEDCQVAWITPGVDCFVYDNKILCERCLRKAKIKSFLKPLWSPFVKFRDK